MEEGDRRDTVRNSVYNPDCSFYHMLRLQSHIYLSDESRHCRQGLNLKTTFQTQHNRPLSHWGWRHFRKVPKRGVLSFALAPCKQNTENEMESNAWNRKLSDIPAITHADIAHTYGKYTKTGNVQFNWPKLLQPLFVTFSRFFFRYRVLLLKAHRFW